MAKETTQQTREQIIELKQGGVTLSQIAKRLGLSLGGVRKFWRRFRDLGKQGLERLSRRPKKSPPGQTPKRVREAILETKRKHLKWGAQFIQGELRRRKFKDLPHRRTIERFLHQYPEFPWQTRRKPEMLQDARRATRLHQLWQMDFIVEQKLNGTDQKYSFLQIRDMASTASILKYPLPAGRSALSSQETVAVIRRAFTQAGYLPEAIRTDHGACFVGPEKDSFPSDFRLYLWGLGITHELIAVRCPAQNGGIERDQRTFSEHFLDDYRFNSHEQLERDAARFGAFQNQYVPSRSVRCQGSTASETAAQLECQARPYKPAQEVKLFSVDRIYAKLGQLHWPRLVSGSGDVSLGHHLYYVGQAFIGQQIEVRCEPQSKRVSLLLGRES
ncbi:MAG: helix-turn-helix domain-containing protein [Blastocatellia bacterium]